MRHKVEALSASDATQLSFQQWLPDKPKASLIIAHGYAEHGGRYAHLAEFLNQHAYAVFALDHRGHGHSEGERATVKVFRQFVTDLKRFVEHVCTLQPDLPRFLLGHSMGGVIAAQFVLEHPHKVEGLILSAPFLQNATSVSPVLLAVSGLVSRLLPGLPTTKLDANLISRDKAVVKAYTEDPLVYTAGTKARMGKELLAAGPYVLGRASGITLPLLLLHGTADKIAAQAGSQALFARVGSADKTFKTYEAYYHEILNELGKEVVYKDILEWLEARQQ